MKKVLLVVNPSSGGELAKEFEKQAIEKLEQHFDEVTVRYTEKAGDASEFAKEAGELSYHSVFVMGGDGTVNEGISGLAELDHPPVFGFFPLGTVNDLARALNIPLNPKEAIEQFSPDRVKPLDIGKVNASYFMNVVAIGTIPEAINDVDVEEKTKFGKFAYFFSALKKMSDNQSHDFRLTIDGEVREIQSSLLLIGSTNSIGGFEQILPDAKVNDGKLHLIYVKDSNFLDMMKAVPQLVMGVDESSALVEYLTFEQLTVELLSEGKLHLNVDGDEGDPLPVNISILPSHLSVYYGQ